MHEEKLTVTETSPYAGQRCAACDGIIEPGHNIVICPRCKMPQHDACWISRGGCSTLGCPQVAAIITGPPSRDEDKMPPKKRWPRVVAIIAIALLLVGFGYNMYTAQQQAKLPRVTLYIPADENQAPITEIVDDYRRTHSGPTIELLFTPLSGYDQKLIIMIAAKDAPDLFWLPLERFQAFAGMDAFTDLQDVVAALDTALPPKRLKLGRADGIQLGIPHPSRTGFFSVFRDSAYPEVAKDILRKIVDGLPVKADVDDEAAGNIPSPGGPPIIPGF